jgi:hypothetical protein
MDLLKQANTLTEGAAPTTPQEVVQQLEAHLKGKKITAFGPAGKGLWGADDKVHTYTIGKIVGHFMKDSSSYDRWGNIDLHLDGYTVGKNTGLLIYTDKTFIKHLKELLKGAPVMKYIKDLSYSEQGMQGRNYVNLDIEVKGLPKAKE